ncbi:unnamed protein product [Cochlearia groenlandica]
MGEIENWRDDLDISGLNLIDEDDSLLLFSSFPDPTSFDFSDKDDIGLSLFGEKEEEEEEEEEGEVVQSQESIESQKTMKFNLRKSLAWDKAFFTNKGVLEPDEICDMIESNDSCERKRLQLQTIQEDVNRSTESVSTLRSDCTVETGGESVSFVETPDKSGKDLGEREATPTSTLPDETCVLFRLFSQMKSTVIRKRPSIRAQGLGKVTKQSVSANKTFISRPLNGLSKTVRASADVKKTKQENKTKLTDGKEPLATRVPLSRRTQPIVSKPVVSFKSGLRSSVASKNEMTSSCSSLESCVSVSSTASKKSSLDSLKQKKAQSLRIASHSLANGSASRAASRSISQPKASPFSASRTYKSNLSSSVRPLSSSVDWSSGSWRPSTPNRMAKGIKKTVLSESGPATQTLNLKPLNNSKVVSAVQDDLKPDQQGAKCGSVNNGGLVRPPSRMKPTGLRVPSPKIGYFDGAKSSDARTPTGSRTGPVSGFTKHGTRSPNELSTASKTKSGKSQPTRSPLVLESIDSKAKSSPVLRSPRLIVAASPKLTNKLYLKVSAEERLNGNAVDNNF